MKAEASISGASAGEDGRRVDVGAQYVADQSAVAGRDHDIEEA
jgi:hypothetical protein